MYAYIQRTNVHAHVWVYDDVVLMGTLFPWLKNQKNNFSFYDGVMYCCNFKSLHGGHLFSSLSSHLLRKTGKTQVAVNEYSVTPKISDDALKQATLSLRSGNMPSFEVVESLVDEEVSGEDWAHILHTTNLYWIWNK